MSISVYNAPDVERIRSIDVFKTSEANRDRNFSSGYQQSFLGTDALQLSGDYGGKKNSRREISVYNYANLLKLLFILILLIAVVVTALSVLVTLGGLISLVVGALFVFFSVFLYSINLNPFNKGTYKKVLGFLR